VIIDQAKGRVPVIAGVSAQDTKTALELAYYAENTGASAILSTPPSAGKPDADIIHSHYQALAQAVNVPIIVHTLNVPIAMAQLYDLIREFPNITHIKEETPEVAGHAISEILRLSDGKVQVFSGSMHLLDELARGAVGAIPGSICVADQVRAYQLFTSGDHKGARQAHNHVVPLIFARNQAYLAWGKEILRRQGIFKTAYVREPSQIMDEYDQMELTAIMDSVGPPF
jgi:4-hydroxy-tetrahydrodipicolinate synthase